MSIKNITYLSTSNKDQTIEFFENLAVALLLPLLLLQLDHLFIHVTFKSTFSSLVTNGNQ